MLYEDGVYECGGMDLDGPKIFDPDTPESMPVSDLPVVWPSTPIVVTCPFCGTKDYTVVKNEFEKSLKMVFIIALAICFVCYDWITCILGLLIMLGFSCSRGSYRDNHYCKECNSKLNKEEMAPRNVW